MAAERNPPIKSMRADPVSGDLTLSRHILPSAATMIGVCATLIGLVKVVELRIGPSHADEYAAMALLIFMVSAVASYVSIRRPGASAWGRRCERLADQCFMLGLVAITLVSIFFAYEIV
jgi:hypothetical protein